MIEWLIIALALSGLIISIYFTFAYYGRIKKSRWIPEILCAREGSSCVTVVQTPYARVFGLPNSLLGIGYYLLVLLLVTRGLVSPLDLYVGDVYAVVSPLHVLFLPSLATIVLGFYLTYVLRRKLHVDCPLCYTAHAINLAIFALLIAAAR